MRKSNKARRSAKQDPAGFFGVKLVMLLAVIAVVGAVVFLTGTKSSNASEKKYKATREYVVDNQSGQRRMPTQEEIDEVVSNLSQLANRPENLPSTEGSGGGELVDLAGGYNGVLLGRATDDGGFETKCVFTFEEGAEFLGLVEDTSAE
jgi:hypothetical protein